MRRPVDPRKFLTPEESAEVVAAIEEVEHQTSAELKLAIVRHCWTDIRRKAARTFRKLRLDRTEQRNGVLILLVTTNREFLIYGDQGVHSRVGPGFWDDVRDVMEGHFRDGRFGQGICEGVRRIGQKLVQHFPYARGDSDEISDEVAYEE